MVSLADTFDRFSRQATKATGSVWAFLICNICFLAWGIWGYYDHYSPFSQMILGTVTGIVSTLMLFLIQQSSNKDTAAIQIKLDEIIKAVGPADNAKRGIEKLPPGEFKKQ